MPARRLGAQAGEIPAMGGGGFLGGVAEAAIKYVVLEHFFPHIPNQSAALLV